jgi:hypothetical protein
MSKGHVYFIRGEGTNMVKIGMTHGKPNLRRDSIQTMSPIKLHRIALLATPDARKLEKRLHELFAPWREWGEWFSFPIRDIGTLKRMTKIKKNERERRNDLFDLEHFTNYWSKRISQFNNWI